MNTTVALVMIGIAVTGGLVLAASFVLREFSEWFLPLLLGALFTTATVWAVLQLFAGVLSLRGFKYSFGFGPSDGITWPDAVRVTTLLLTAELVTIGVWLADYLDDRGQRTAAPAWAWAHVSGVCRVIWHCALAPVMLVRDWLHHRSVRWPLRPRNRFVLAAVLGDLAGDFARGLLYPLSAARRFQWRRLVTVTRTVPVPRDEAMVVEGVGVAGEVLQTWRVGENLPAPRESAEQRRERTRV